MIVRILIACCLVAVTVAIHSGGPGPNLEPSMASTCPAPPAFLESDVAHDSNRLVAPIDPRDPDCSLGTSLLVENFCLMSVAVYFAGVTYTTVGYGDLLLPKEWQLFGPLEGLTGILMCGLSTAFFFAVLSKRFAIWSGSSRS